MTKNIVKFFQIVYNIYLLFFWRGLFCRTVANLPKISLYCFFCCKKLIYLYLTMKYVSLLWNAILWTILMFSNIFQSLQKPTFLRNFRITEQHATTLLRKEARLSNFFKTEYPNGCVMQLTNTY